MIFVLSQFKSDKNALQGISHPKSVIFFIIDIFACSDKSLQEHSLKKLEENTGSVETYLEKKKCFLVPYHNRSLTNSVTPDSLGHMKSKVCWLHSHFEPFF